MTKPVAVGVFRPIKSTDCRVSKLNLANLKHANIEKIKPINGSNLSNEKPSESVDSFPPNRT